MASHLSECAGCCQFAQQLVALEQAWRSLAVPQEAEDVKHAFLMHLTRTEPVPAPLPEARHPRFRRLSRRRVLQLCGASAASLLAVGAVSWLLLPVVPMSSKTRFQRSLRPRWRWIRRSIRLLRSAGRMPNFCWLKTENSAILP